MELNKVANERASVECRKCKKSTNHLILASADLSGTETVYRDHEVHWASSYQIIQCMGCDTISFRRCSESSEDAPVQVGHNEWEDAIHETVYPNPNEGREPLSDARILPPVIERIYEETIASLNNHQPILCGIGIRALIETISKEKKASSRSLSGKINDLVSMGVLSQEDAKILHKLRTLGNAAAHQAKPHTEKELSLAMDVVEHLLQGVYILQHHANRTFSE